MKCPYCGKPLKYEDTIDTEIYNDKYIEIENHYCENCNKNFLREVHWEMIYKNEL